MADDDKILLNVAMLQERLGLSEKAARGRAKRAIKAGRWAEQPRNDHSGALWFYALLADLNPTGRVPAAAPRGVPEKPARAVPAPPPREVPEEGLAAVIRELTERLIEAKADALKAAAAEETAETGLAAAREEIAHLSDQISRLRADLSTLATEKAVIDALAGKADTALVEANGRIERLNGQLADVQADLRTTAALQMGTVEENNRLFSENEALRRRLERAEGQRGLFHRIFSRK